MTKTLRALACAAIASYAAVAAAQPAAPSRDAQMTSAQVLALAQSDRKGLIARNMTLTPEESAKFWPLYESFRRDLAPVEQQRSRAMLDYVNTDGNVTPANAKRLMTALLDAEQDEAKKRKAQFKRLLKVLPADKAGRYMQIENRIRTATLYEAARVMPLAR